jgi:hypothetical protein
MVEVKNNEVARQPHLNADFSPDPLRDKMPDQYAGQKDRNQRTGQEGQAHGPDIWNCLLTKFGHPYIFFKKNS